MKTKSKSKVYKYDSNKARQWRLARTEGKHLTEHNAVNDAKKQYNMLHFGVYVTWERGMLYRVKKRNVKVHASPKKLAGQPLNRKWIWGDVYPLRKIN